MMKRTILSVVLASIAIFAACSKSSSSSASLSSASFTKERSFDKVALRGYGTVTGSLWKPQVAGSVLEIDLENEANAKLTLSKYLSDIQLLPKIKLTETTVSDSKVSTINVEEQGSIAALRYGSKVLIVSSPEQAAFEKILGDVIKDLGKNYVSTPETEVPMWLDRWDKFGFRFYYRSWETPKGQNLNTYNILEEFEYAQKMERSGFVFWAEADAIDNAEGLDRAPFWHWGLQAATKKMLPSGLNLGVGAASWLPNRYRDQNAQKAPQYCGGFYKPIDYHHGGIGFISWNATTAKDTELSILQNIVKEAITRPNLTTILEPHGELRHGQHDIFMEYGPVADATFRDYLKTKYKNISALNEAWGAKASSWDDIRVPEVAYFLGWGEQAIDLSGEWKVGYEKFAEGQTFKSNELKKTIIIPTEGTPAEWLAETFDDSAWPTVVAPGHDRTMFLPQRPAVYRRTINVSKEWLDKNPRVWLYVWDLNTGSNNSFTAAVNGKTVGQDKLAHATLHWGGYEITKELKPGANQVSLRIPKGVLGYRVYISPHEPKQYPNLGEHMNAQWCDFTSWIGWSRVSCAKRGMEMIREVEPNRQIDLMAPGGYADGIKNIALAYGGNFKNTGYMGAFWADDLPALMRGAGFPFSLEPGGPADTLPGFKKMMGLYATEGIHAIDYFIHIGNILWNPEIRQNFEETLPMIKLIGKYHAPKAEVAALYSTRGNELTGFPWGQDFNTNLSSGYWSWNVRGFLMQSFESDALSESSFSNGDANRYKVIIDSNTSIIDDDLLSKIEQYVRNGGTFITFSQTGRHTSVKKDSWPIAKLTGYEVVKIDPLDATGNPTVLRTLKPAPDQDAFKDELNKQRGNGLTLKKVADDTKDLLLWEDGSVAVGSRQIGKGYIIQVGCKFRGHKIFDRLEGSAQPEEAALIHLFTALLKWRSIAPIEFSYEKPDTSLFSRHYVSNNGLYDVWTIWNRSDKTPVENAFILPKSVTSKSVWDVQAKVPLQITDGKIPLSLEPYQYRVYITPRNQIAQAPVDWFELQRNWWRGTTKPAGKPLPPVPHKFSLDLDYDWAFKPLPPGEDATPYSLKDVDSSAWTKIRIGIWTPAYPDVKHAILRKTFTVPKEWSEGNIVLWIKSWAHSEFFDKGRIWLDGTLISDWSNKGVADVNPNDLLKPGSTHTLAIEIEGTGSLVGSRSNAWLYFWPKPVQTLDLSGPWSPSDDALAYKTPVQLPGEYTTMTFRRTVKIPAEMSAHNTVIDITAENGIVGVLVNGHWTRRLHHLIGEHFQLNITPWVKYGEENEIELVNLRQDAPTQDPTKVNVKDVHLEFHKKDIYP